MGGNRTNTCPSVQEHDAWIAGFTGGQPVEEPSGLLAWWFLNREREHKLDALDLPLLGEDARQKGPPAKNVFALERTYLAWIHMAITVGAVAAAMVGVTGTKDAASTKVGRQKKLTRPVHQSTLTPLSARLQRPWSA